jgi:hypothetical protein
MAANIERNDALQYLLDRMAISDCMVRYCRGVDRLDKELMLSAYHPDAIDDHGVIVAQAEAFVDWALDYHFKTHVATQHIVLNHTCELEGDTAHAETYFFYIARFRSDGSVTQSGGRYIDRLERRGGRWAIAARRCMIEWMDAKVDAVRLAERLAVTQAAGPPTRDHDDPSYMRPLGINPDRIPRA